MELAHYPPLSCGPQNILVRAYIGTWLRFSLGTLTEAMSIQETPISSMTPTSLQVGDDWGSIFGPETYPTCLAKTVSSGRTHGIQLYNLRTNNRSAL